MNIVYKAELQDTYKKNNSNKYKANLRNYTGNLYIMGIDNIPGSIQPFAEKQDLKNITETIDWTLTVHPNNNTIVFSLNEANQEFSVPAKIKKDDFGRWHEFTINTDEFPRLHFYKRLNNQIHNLLSLYNFLPENSQTQYQESLYRCYLRRQLIRCFTEVNFIIKNDINYHSL
jgi:hypothetical protein